MPFSAGVFSLAAGNPVVTGTTISSTWANNTLNDIADNGLSICLLKDGTQTPTANIPLGGFRLTGLGNATAVADAPRASQVQNSAFNTLSSVSGASTITGNATPTPAAYAEGQVFSFLAVGANAAGPTLNVSSLGALPIFWAGATCTSSMWSTGSRLDVTYLATSSQTGFHIMGHSGFMPANLLRVRGSIISGGGDGSVFVTAPSADGQVLVSTASASAGVAWVSADAQFGVVAINTVLAGTATGSPTTPSFRALTAQDCFSINLVSEVSATSTSVAFTVPSGAKRITLSVNGVSMSGTSNLMLQIGDAGGVETSGYTGSSANISAGSAGGPGAFTAGFIVSTGSTAAELHYAQATLALANSGAFTWSYSGIDGSSVPTTTFGAGIKSLSQELTTVILTTVNGTDTFDAGSVAIQYER